MVSKQTLTNVNISSASTTQMVTFNHFNPLKVTSGNYNHWIPQIVPHLKVGNLFGYVDGTHYSPPPTLVTTLDGVVLVSPNPYFLH
jgi:hypothetical protein